VDPDALPRANASQRDDVDRRRQREDQQAVQDRGGDVACRRSVADRENRGDETRLHRARHVRQREDAAMDGNEQTIPDRVLHLPARERRIEELRERDDAMLPSRRPRQRRDEIATFSPHPSVEKVALMTTTRASGGGRLPRVSFLTQLVRDGVTLRDEGGVLSSLPADGAPSAGRFEGLYGPLYDRVIQSDVLRRLAPLAYGDAGPLPDLDGFAWRVADGTRADGGRRCCSTCRRAAGRCCRGSSAPATAGRVVESDLGAQMLERAAAMARRTAELDVALLRADAHDLPLRDGSVDGVVSLNGLHCMPDPRRFVEELGRVTRTGGRLFLITLVSGGNRRGELINRGGQLGGVLPGPPPSRTTLERWLQEAGFSDREDLGGKALAGLAATKR
jgi:SAM-dependent methyltransferase